jgi:UDP-N-acetylglucosamine diphosphorylase / glucose-1-phosphate thymidylyltransferase / UDP-N-acetylgalactosamine diphosphorylase / glucosamine-1-phosphate N-acetyltransferase / galactosamine-1-phosphate N-acetyltransferase
MVRSQEFVERALSSPLSWWCDQPPWSIVTNAQQIVQEMLAASGAEFDRQGTIAIHRTATIEAGAVIRGPAIIGAQCFIAAGSYLRGGVWLDERCVIGPGTELKASFVFSGSKLAHFNFIGDTILGSDVNLEAGSIIANYRNERGEKRIKLRIATELYATGVKSLGRSLARPRPDRGQLGGRTRCAHQAGSGYSAPIACRPGE